MATKTDAESGKTLYYAAYNGTIKAGIDFDQIGIKADERKKSITVTLPQARILETTVDPGTIDYIFVVKKAETETVAQEAYGLCVEDLARRSEEDSEKLLDAARENARNAVDGMLSPWFSQMSTGFTLVIQ